MGLGVDRHRLLLAIILVYAASFRWIVLDRPFDYDAEGSGSLYGVLARNYLRFDWAQTHGMPVLTVGRSAGAPTRSVPTLVTLATCQTPPLELRLAGRQGSRDPHRDDRERGCHVGDDGGVC